MPLEPPRGMYPARVDDKGRLKLPVPFQQYLGALPEPRFFVTSLDRRIAAVYPLSAWREVEKFFESSTEDPALYEDVWFTANDLGAEAEMDSQGRLLLSPELRRALGVENQPVKVYSVRGHLEVISEALYQERQQRAAQGAEEKVLAVRRKCPRV